MALERTLSIIKPDGVKKGVIGACLDKFERAGLKVVATRMIQLTQAQAEEFYGVHRARPFFKDLVSFMISGPVVVSVLEGEDAIAMNRKIMGATNPANAEAGTIRKLFATSIDQNTVHGSDAPETAKVEVAFFFPGIDVQSYERV